MSLWINADDWNDEQYVVSEIIQVNGRWNSFLEPVLRGVPQYANSGQYCQIEIQTNMSVGTGATTNIERRMVRCQKI